MDKRCLIEMEEGGDGRSIQMVVFEGSQLFEDDSDDDDDDDGTCAESSHQLVTPVPSKMDDESGILLDTALQLVNIDDVRDLNHLNEMVGSFRGHSPPPEPVTLYAIRLTYTWQCIDAEHPGMRVADWLNQSLPGRPATEAHGA
jgi:hypothetical protein